MLLKYLYLCILTSAYFIGVFVGVQNASFQQEEKVINNNGNLELDTIYAKEPFQRFLSIASNNIIVAMKNMLFGVFSLGLFSIACTFYNGVILGAVLGDCFKLLPLNIILKSTLPHCTEILGIILFGYIGFIISIRLIFRTKMHSNKRIIIFIIIAFLSILIAAFIESYVSMS